ncbi:DNA adenine methylase [Paenibacillus polymyxa]|uniref:site-specific DNA-methyltransferase (adenine-specific) n=1 Tax=Paenibacillus polymyxa TaxID=1406 RepID=A0A8I1IU06_PAEPO|nr:MULTISPECIES: DNA adenine methylase [Paenibacillus]MBM0634588.1 DNA adenine methylase [Paenibacillus polymyxa]
MKGKSMYRYIGNKAKLIDVLIDEIRSIIGTTGKVADLMCGTATVSSGLKSEGYEVVAADVMTYAYYHAMVKLLINNPPVYGKLLEKEIKINESAGDDGYQKVISYLNSLQPKKGYFFREFSPGGVPFNGTPSRKYFTSENAMKIDAIRETLYEWENDELLSEIEIALLKHDLILSVNPIANISGTYGHFHSKFVGKSLNQFKLKAHFEYDLFSEFQSINHTVLKGYAEDLAKDIEVDLCYIDPPYMKRQYAANYHILETLARGDEPEAVGLSGLRPWRDQYSDFCSKVRIRDSFKKILTNVNTKNFLISYSEDGLLSLEQLVSFFEDFGKVHVKEVKYKRFRSNNSPLGQEINEYLIWVKK